MTPSTFHRSTRAIGTAWLLLVAAIGGSAQVPLTREIAPGVRHAAYTLDGPFTVDVIEIDLRSREVTVETFRPDSLRRTTEQVRRRNEEGAEVLAAVNADFFSFKTHWPVGNQVSRGELVIGVPSRRSHFGITLEGRPAMDPMSFSGAMVSATGDTFGLRAVNDPLDSTGGSCYTERWGPTTRTPPGTWEAELAPITPTLVNGRTKAVVTSIATGGNGGIAKGRWTVAFSAGRSPSTIGIGDTVMLLLQVGADRHVWREVVGAGGRILRNGVQADTSEHRAERIGMAFTTDRHPRTFVAIDRDTTKLFLGTVDGRQTGSVGMNFAEMATFLLGIGAWNAVNLDGGGSTTMVVEGEIVNRPSDRPGERPVANTVLVVRRR